MIGGVLAGAGKRQIERLEKIGYNIGVAFQIRDDILDYDGGDRTGKPTGADLRERKITLPLLGALCGSPREEEIRSMIRDIPAHPEYTAAINAFVHANGGVDYASKRLADFVHEAVEVLSVLPASRDREILEYLANQLTDKVK